MIFLAFLGREQPPSGGCVLKPELGYISLPELLQPPSGGCVLKLDYLQFLFVNRLSSRLRAAVC